MKKVAGILTMLFLITIPVNAMDFTAPAAPPSAQEFMPPETENFSDGLRYIIREALDVIQPSFLEASEICISLIAAALILGLLSEFSGNSTPAIKMAGAASACVVLFQPVDSLIRLGTDTVQQISQYGKLLLPVMTGALAAQGAVTKSGALYTATAFFDAVLSSTISDLLIPMVYVFLSIAVVCNLVPQPLLVQMRNFLKWLMTWGLKIVLYIFTGYISITGVVGGTTDAAMLKATKLTISGMVPVVGNILSDASEAVLVSAGMMKNAAGIYGILAVISLCIRPFIQIGSQYLMLKLTTGVTEMFGTKQMAGIIKDFSTAMGLVLAMTGTVCMIFLISMICFMKGVS